MQYQYNNVDIGISGTSGVSGELSLAIFHSQGTVEATSKPAQATSEHIPTTSNTFKYNIINYIDVF